MSAVTTLLRSSDPSLIAAVSDVVHSVGEITLEVASPDEFFDRLGQGGIALVLFHVSGPEDRADAVALLRQLEPRLVKVPALIVSDNDDPEQELALLRLGAADYLTRPLDLRRLAYLVEQHTLE